MLKLKTSRQTQSNFAVDFISTSPLNLDAQKINESSRSPRRIKHKPTSESPAGLSRDASSDRVCILKRMSAAKLVERQRVFFLRPRLQHAFAVPPQSRQRRNCPVIRWRTLRLGSID